MIVTDDTHILFIEPMEPKTLEPVMDSLTEGMKKLMEDAVEGDCWRGWHDCCCGEHSTSCDYILKSGRITNSLAVHYLMWHRPEVPRSELAKVAEDLYMWINHKKVSLND